jgi:HlyD family secretion protein
MKNILSLIVPLILAIIAGCTSNDSTLGGSGLLEADDVVVSAETSGRIEKLNFDEGDTVNKGDTLLIIDPSRQLLKLESANATYNVAEEKLNIARLLFDNAVEKESFATKERDRIAILVKSNTATQKQLDQLEHELTKAIISKETASANIKSIKSELKRIKAEINIIKRNILDSYPVVLVNGTVIEKYISLGEHLLPGKAIAKIANLSSIWVKIYLPAGDFANVKLGDKAKVDTEEGEQQFDGTVVWTSSEAEFTPKNVQTKKSRANLVYAVKVKIDNSDNKLKIGMPVFVTIGE